MDVIGGDLIEHYQRGRSAWWYWREVLATIATNTWCEVRQNPLWLIGAVAAGCLVVFSVYQIVMPLEYSLLVRYVLDGRQARPGELPLAVFAEEAPFQRRARWTVARCARKSRTPAVFLVAALSVVLGVWAMWQNAQNWPAPLRFSVLSWLWLLPADVALILFGGGLLTGGAKQPIQTH
jgi:hypothetical protein